MVLIDSEESEGYRAYCKKCYEKYQKDMENIKAEYIKNKTALMLERAIRILERQKIVIDSYREAVSVVREFSSENPGKFASAHEMIAAIVLIKNRVKTKTQYKIGKYRADFCLPELKIILEIDGDRHENSLYQDNERDKNIRNILGKDWEVVRIKTEYLEQNAKMLIKAIKTIRAEKQKIRSSNYGLLPEWYSKRDRSKKPKKQEYGDELLLDD